MKKSKIFHLLRNTWLLSISPPVAPDNFKNIILVDGPPTTLNVAANWDDQQRRRFSYGKFRYSPLTFVCLIYQSIIHKSIQTASI